MRRSHDDATKQGLKRLVRARMSKTGESYSRPQPDPLQVQTERDDRRLRALAGTKDAALKEKPARGAVGARARLPGAERMSHRDIAAFVSKKYKGRGLRAQTCHRRHERIKGLRVGSAATVP